MAKRIRVEKGSLKAGETITATSNVFAYKPQARVVRSEEGNTSSKETGSCAVEDEDEEFSDVNFQILLVGHGPATVNWLRTTARDDPNNMDPSGDACDDESGFNAVRFDGAAAHSDDSSHDAFAELSARALQLYTSNRTETVTSDGISEVGIGYAESIVSQRAADRVASIIATKMADTQLLNSLPPILSTGDESE